MPNGETAGPAAFTKGRVMTLTLQAFVQSEGPGGVCVSFYDRPGSRHTITVKPDLLSAPKPASPGPVSEEDRHGHLALRLVARLHAEAVLSEGQCCKALDMDRVDFRAFCDALAAEEDDPEPGT